MFNNKKFVLATIFILMDFVPLITNLKNCTEEGNNDTLILLHSLFRHGERTSIPEASYPNDPYINETFQPYGPGALTNAGKRKVFAIGAALRNSYDKFLDVYFPGVLEARSADTQRSMASLQLVLASLYEPKGKLTWHPDLAWQPIPYIYTNYADDHLIGVPFLNCPNYITAYKDYLRSSEVLAILERNKEFFAYLSRSSGMKVVEFFDVFKIYFTLIIEEEWGLKLPAWTNEVWPDKLKMGTIQYFSFMTGTPKLRKLLIGLMLKKIVNDTQQKIDNTLKPSNRKVFLYSANDLHIVGLFVALGLYYPHMPCYGAYIVIEVHKICDTYGIKILYQDYAADAPKLMKIPGCEEFCPWDRFKEIVEDYLPESDNIC